MSQISHEVEDDISIVLCGEAGQGIQTVENILVRAVKNSGCNVFSTKEYMSRVRGGLNSTLIRASSTAVRSYVDRIDVLIALSEGTINHLKDRLSDDTLIIAANGILEEESKQNLNVIEIPLIEMASEIGGSIFSNIIAAGVISRILNIELETFNKCIEFMFQRKGEEILEKDLQAGKKGYELGETLLKEYDLIVDIQKTQKVKNQILINGTEAVGLGCIAAGCNFMSAYPMTPSSPLQVFIAQNAHEFDIIFEQTEDEIAALNMALGASYAGARAMTATSGSGFALMEEAVGLSGMTETPVVIYLAQRPGPAVGLPTRTAQEDLNLALYSGTGESPRAIFAPGTIEDAFHVSWHAFNLADKYQIPVFILSDQYFADIHYNLPPIDLKEVQIENYIFKTAKNYRRYEITENGISPRGIPGFGEGLVVADSDEHDEEGHITENLTIRTKMVDKRLNKLENMKKEVLKPKLVGEEDYDILMVGWGSTYGPITEALEEIGDDKIAFLHYKQVYPLHEETINHLKKAKTTVIFENNATSQFASLIKLETGFDIENKILKYNGMPFSVEEVINKINSMKGGI
ncbi:MAG: 2-oxoacid:ferredoxin oxidoreductase subunit alpha [Methanobacterium sp. BRmetb2]|jgi:2-oxoglutarate ferredoxin oxidoreductase subunit alpha|nr:MAG: 2-oxoacid:ferredoxin oxidoreductase subunit alpha [Methanobacterium sp. BRmetb2]